MITNEERAELISLRLQQAEQAIEQAVICRAQNLPGLAANRVYYGMFYAMLALGLLRQFESSKHQQVIGWFNKNFVHTGIFPTQFSRIVKKAFETRNNADYQVNLVPTDADLDVLFTDMQVFIATIKTWIASNQP